jgi:hypothetical protein
VVVAWKDGHEGVLIYSCDAEGAEQNRWSGALVRRLNDLLRLEANEFLDIEITMCLRESEQDLRSRNIPFGSAQRVT